MTRAEASVAIAIVKDAKVTFRSIRVSLYDVLGTFCREQSGSGLKEMIYNIIFASFSRARVRARANERERDINAILISSLPSRCG